MVSSSIYKRHLSVCLFVVCRLLGSSFLSGHAALPASDTNACARTCTIMMYDQLCGYLYARAMSCVHVGHASLATVAFKLLLKSECVRQFYVRRTFFTHVHGCKSSHLETQQLLDKMIYKDYNHDCSCKPNHAGCAISTANHFDQ